MGPRPVQGVPEPNAECPGHALLDLCRRQPLDHDSSDVRPVTGATIPRQLASAEDEAPYWPAGVLPILDWGCAMYAAVDCLSETATVLLFDPNAMTDDGAAAWFVDAASLAEWLETWLAGTGWYREDADEHEDAAEPTPWEMAASRIAE
ncbi:SMI1/KNR4 family protein [Streptomyces sp. NPDC126503]|uniref:SMI1/KNR4 family protein n=1 Tax=Streptomyces sp. NPDC126503 TaxID=3155315 RepID=UPI00332BBD31